MKGSSKMSKSVRLPTYRKHATGQAVVRLQGRDYYLGVFDSPASHRAYQELIGKYLLTGEVPKPVPKKPEPEDAGNTMAILAAKFLKYAEGYYQQSNEYTNYRLALQPVVQLYGDWKVAEFTCLEFRRCQDWWLSRGVSRQYINKQSKRLRAVLKWATSWRLYPAALLTEVQAVPGLKAGRTSARECQPVKPVEDDIVAKTIEHLPPVVADMVRLQRLTGCRPGEICSIKPSMVDRAGDVWEIRLADHKTAWRGKQRIIYVGPKGQAILRPYLLRAADAYCFSPAEADWQRRQARHAARKTKMTCGNIPKAGRSASRLGDSYNTLSYGRAIRYGCLKAWPMPKSATKAKRRQWIAKYVWSPNQLRHTMATDVRRQFGLEHAATVLGHSELTVTQVYAEADRLKAIDITRQIG
jgi:integrase